jgi:hypothetical protein
MEIIETAVQWTPYGCEHSHGPLHRPLWEREATCLMCARTVPVEVETPTVAEQIPTAMLAELMAAATAPPATATG